MTFFDNIIFILKDRKILRDVKSLKVHVVMDLNTNYKTMISHYILSEINIDAHKKYCLPTNKDIDDCKSLSKNLKGNNIKNTCERISLYYRDEIKYDKKLQNFRKQSFIKRFLICIYNREKLGLFSYYVFLLPIPINEVLKYKLAICTEFVKITTAIILNLYPNSEIYLIFTRTHVATGIKTINNEFWIIDQDTVSTLCEWIQEQGQYVSLYILTIENGKIDFKFYTSANIENGKVISFNESEDCKKSTL